MQLIGRREPSFLGAFHGTIVHSLGPGPDDLEIIEDGLLVVDAAGVIAALHRSPVPEADVPRRVAEALGHVVSRSSGEQRGEGEEGEEGKCVVRRLEPGREFLAPGLVDTHNHAPQWAMRGRGQGMHILDWLAGVTFPQEATFADPSGERARRVYGACVRGMLRQGVTTAAYYGSAHAEATKVLADTCLGQGQRALVGKCNMDREAPAYYRDKDAEQSLRDTREVMAHVRRIDPEGRQVRYVLTPRFAICCSAELLKGLGQLAREYDGDGDGAGGMGMVAVQTHFNEARQEMARTRELFPDFKDETELYEHFGLLRRGTILAHCCYLQDRRDYNHDHDLDHGKRHGNGNGNDRSGNGDRNSSGKVDGDGDDAKNDDDDDELDRLAALGVGIAHCPVSNMTVGGGFMAAPVRRLLRAGLDVGLGTDSGGGFSSSVLDAMRMAIVASNAREAADESEEKALSIAEVFFLATLGGARVCGLGDRVGSFAPGKEFDALLVDGAASDGVMAMLDDDRDDARAVFDKFVMTGDDRNIREVYIGGRQVKGATTTTTTT
ncbi:guanine deaminase [Xylariaceae sp. FL0804]|nr:guanine deaminase [Xylariaceae sp. FL0804]